MDFSDLSQVRSWKDRFPDMQGFRHFGEKCLKLVEPVPVSAGNEATRTFRRVPAGKTPDRTAQGCAGLVTELT